MVWRIKNYQQYCLALFLSTYLKTEPRSDPHHFSFGSNTLSQEDGLSVFHVQYYAVSKHKRTASSQHNSNGYDGSETEVTQQDTRLLAVVLGIHILEDSSFTLVWWAFDIRPPSLTGYLKMCSLTKRRIRNNRFAHYNGNGTSVVRVYDSGDLTI